MEEQVLKTRTQIPAMMAMISWGAITNLAIYKGAKAQADGSRNKMKEYVLKA